MTDEIMVSVSCTAYNHEKYIRQCLDSLLMQKTDFKYEIIVHDDASTDNTANIIREYEKKYPNVVKPIYQTENKCSKGFKIINYIVPKMRGKYVAHCEGDDFWTDPYKLQKQFDIMEKNPDCSICVHKVLHVYENGNATDRYQPNFDLNECKINLEKYLDFGPSHPFQTTSYFIRSNVKKDYAFNPPEFVGKFCVGDVPTILFALTKGNMYYLNEAMSCYRLFSKGSWSSKNFANSKRQISHCKNIITGYNAFNEFSNYKYNTLINDIIGKDIFLLELLSKNYKTCLNKKYRKYFNKYLNKKEKISVIIFAIFPFAEKIYEKLKNR